ncbi:hypothetical protein CIFRMM251M_17405 [Citrobacter freundii]
MNNKTIILTGDRPTGPLHLGHYVGSLRQRAALQHDYQQFILVADLQGLTDNGSTPQKIRNNIPEVLADYLAAGIDPSLTTMEGANKRGNSSRLTQSFHFFMFEPIFSPVNALNQPI